MTADRPDAGTGAPDDQALLEAHVAGDPEAFGTLFRRHRDRLWAVALRTAGDPDDASDALQEAMISAYRRADSFRGGSAVTTWLHRIVVNACLDRLRRNRVRSAEPLPDDLEERLSRGAVLADPDGSSGETPVDPAESVVAAERRRIVLAALARLPAEQRAALVLVDMEGYPVGEAGVILDCPAGTVKSRCARGRARLAGLLRSDRPDGSDGTHDPPGASEQRGPSPSRTRPQSGGAQP